MLPPRPSPPPLHRRMDNLYRGSAPIRIDSPTTLNMKNAVFWNITPCCSCRNRRFSARRLLITANVPSSPIFSPWWWRRYVPPKSRFLQQPHSANIPEHGILQDIKNSSSLTNPLYYSVKSKSCCYRIEDGTPEILWKEFHQQFCNCHDILVFACTTPCSRQAEQVVIDHPSSERAWVERQTLPRRSRSTELSSIFWEEGT
jgi:hypothetical protein